MVTALDERTEPVVLVQIMIGAVVKDGGRKSGTTMLIYRQIVSLFGE